MKKNTRHLYIVAFVLLKCVCPVICTGCDPVEFDGRSYFIQRFTHTGQPRISPSNDSFTNHSFTFEQSTIIDILIVGGGGAGGTGGLESHNYGSAGGGGSGGEYKLLQGVLVDGTKTIRVGAGGLGSDEYENGIEGSSSAFDGTLYMSIGGGGGGFGHIDENRDAVFSPGTSGAYGGGGGGAFIGWVDFPESYMTLGSIG
jgi:hypothetical protein